MPCTFGVEDIMWLRCEVKRVDGVFLQIWFRSKEESDNYLQRSGSKILAVKLIERRCGKLTTDPPEPPKTIEEVEEDSVDRIPTEEEINEEQYFNPEVGVDDYYPYNL